MGLFLLPVTAVSASHQLVIQEQPSLRLVTHDWLLTDVTEAFPGYCFPDETLVITNQSAQPLDLVLDLEYDQSLAEVMSYYKGELAIETDSQRFSLPLFSEGSQQLAIEPKTEATLVVKRRIVGEGHDNATQGLTGNQLVKLVISANQGEGMPSTNLPPLGQSKGGILILWGSLVILVWVQLKKQVAD